MKDIIDGIKIIFVLAIVVILFEYSTLLGLISLVFIGVLFYRNVFKLAKKEVYRDNPGLRPWIDKKRYMKEHNLKDL